MLAWISRAIDAELSVDADAIAAIGVERCERGAQVGVKLRILAGFGDARVDACLQTATPGVERGRLVAGTGVGEKAETGEAEALVVVQERPVAEQRLERAARARVTGVARADQQAWNGD